MEVFYDKDNVVTLEEYSVGSIEVDSIPSLPDGHFYKVANNLVEIEEHIEIKISRSVSEAKYYLTSTDFYYVRQLETGEEVPEDVLTKRAEARAYIREVEDA